jgi:hypothetical protein
MGLDGIGEVNDRTSEEHTIGEYGADFVAGSPAGKSHIGRRLRLVLTRR